MITVTTKIKASLDKVWTFWTEATHIKNWYFASDEWYAPQAENDLKEGGKFKIRMEAKDASFGFDLEGTYTTVKAQKLIEFVLGDDRKVSVSFLEADGEVVVIERFDPETENPEEMQKQGWQAILDNFKKYVEAA